MGASGLIRSGRVEPFSRLQLENTEMMWLSVSQKEVPHIKFAGTVFLGFLASTTVRNKFL